MPRKVIDLDVTASLEVKHSKAANIPESIHVDSKLAEKVNDCRRACNGKVYHDELIDTRREGCGARRHGDAGAERVRVRLCEGKRLARGEDTKRGGWRRQRRDEM
jgi:hypothetical protein